MNNRRFNDFETGVDELLEVQEGAEVNLSKKLERRRRIEDLFEERRLREELSEFDLL
ncbi:PA3496 family putative envelope integrity protein [Legionella sp. D16C41]|uniref:PA3496 family putative envelope integrity protein n=1 Tax=Legionella sp. D16C41 TaxID=3402688 RepID=UPI003AF90C50